MSSPLDATQSSSLTGMVDNLKSWIDYYRYHDKEVFNFRTIYSIINSISQIDPSAIMRLTEDQRNYLLSRFANMRGRDSSSLLVLETRCHVFENLSKVENFPEDLQNQINQIRTLSRNIQHQQKPRHTGDLEAINQIVHLDGSPEMENQYKILSRILNNHPEIIRGLTRENLTTLIEIFIGMSKQTPELENHYNVLNRLLPFVEDDEALSNRIRLSINQPQHND